jgi:hypothetical protein
MFLSIIPQLDLNQHQTEKTRLIRIHTTIVLMIANLPVQIMVGKGIHSMNILTKTHLPQKIVTHPKLVNSKVGTVI